ncbi:MAG TPA: transglycosylase SLT domain-containing protein [Pyrinomonadaceae bacterium]|nr:transglycosylase SLT domain-containing protein [Pyrinomonadaceae bacterium]
MKTKTVILLIAVMLLSSESLRAQGNQPNKLYQQMNQAERTDFVAKHARAIGRRISGRDYEFTTGFESDIQQALEQYVGRIGNGTDRDFGKRDVRLVIERAQVHAPTLMAVFNMRDLSPLIGLYIPWVESEYVNFDSPNSLGALGMFQFLPKTGQRYGLSPQDLLDVAKSADAAARYISDGIETFKDDPMKEALALLAYNRGAKATAQDLKLTAAEGNKQCSICVLSAARSRLDENFRSESVFYVPRFFAAAIIGENPNAFGLQSRPLSSY